MRGRILDSDYIEETGWSFVQKATPYGIFWGDSFVHPDDQDIANPWDGLEFAEMKCDIQAAREKAKRMRQRAIGMEIALKNLDNAGVNDPATLDNLERQVWAAHREADKYKEIYEEFRDSFQAYTDMKLKRRRDLRGKINDMNSAE